MNRDESWAVIADQRRAVADLLAELTDPEWDTPSLCADWRVRDVAAHLALAPQPPGLLTMTTEAIRAGGRFHRLNHDLAVRHANRPSADLVAELRRHADSRRLPAVTNYRNILFDVLVHAQDIAVPLERPLVMPLRAAAAGATRVWTMGWPFWARRRLPAVRLVATDTDWSVGDGAEVCGPISALLLLLTGRRARCPELSGPGTARL
ncbi:maleylpyruvate isomerase family mycothiol-dependent enzyme [Actinoplanes sichuanensis]|uniref:Maleylpyruvate isomerase family mycothiol-dependent enzyme n=1 Tax=Actinoplanes sichuanensis TaxID=512349 RepID=A0ABW4ALW4_9ACTN|nr:maleylpyruvate isomerase family mycothiol-dependent enzyme [Actinoplanes sichuanensis]BEL10865.1 maleylpyruvate isomerase family mycothiol-dependent enzyme [Actinoplanes sichuanensis]